MVNAAVSPAAPPVGSTGGALHHDQGLAMLTVTRYRHPHPARPDDRHQPHRCGMVHYKSVRPAGAQQRRVVRGNGWRARCRRPTPAAGVPKGGWGSHWWRRRAVAPAGIFDLQGVRPGGIGNAQVKPVRSRRGPAVAIEAGAAAQQRRPARRSGPRDRRNARSSTNSDGASHGVPGRFIAPPASIRRQSSVIRG
jgi:hypothetical protein